MTRMLVATRPGPRWALVESLTASPASAHHPDLALARVLHPASPVTEVVVVVEDRGELAWVERVLRARGTARPLRVVAVVETVELGLEAVTAGATAVAVADGGDLAAALATVDVLPDAPILLPRLTSRTERR